MKYTKQQLKKIHVDQLGEYACGLACLSAITNYYNGSIAQEKLREISGTTLNGTSLLGIYQAAQAIGFDAKGYEADFSNLKSIDRPVILHVVIDRNRPHYVVCYGFKNNQFIIGDPAWGIVNYTEEELASIWNSKALLSLTPNQAFITKSNNSQKQWQWFRSLIKEDIPILAVASILGIAIAVLGLSTAIFSQKLIDDFLPNDSNEKILFGFIALLFLLIARAGLGYFRGLLMAKQGKDLNVRIVNSFIGKIIHLPLSFFNSYSTGDLIARMNDSIRIRKTVAMITGDVLINVLVIFVSSVYICILSIQVGLLATSSIIFFFLIAWHFHPKILSQQKEMMISHAANEAQYIDALTGISTIKSYNKENIIKERISSVYDIYQSKNYNLAITGNSFSFFTQLISGIYITILFGLGVWQVLENNLKLGELIALVTVGGSMIPSLAGLMVANIQLQEAKVAFTRMYEIASLNRENGIGRNNNNNEFNEHKPSNNVLCIENLVYRFPGKSTVIENLSLQIRSGTISTLFGQIGSGKSTLVDLIQGFYPVETGTININGRHLNDYNINEWRSKIAVVSQQEKIFNSTVLDNICLSNDPNELEKCSYFIDDVGFTSLFNQLPQNHMTLCGEEGNQLSGGQKQLVAIARALYKHPEFLILDESTSVMDTKTEKEVMKVLKKIMNELHLGVLMVTHRIGLARQTDRIYLLKDGCIEDFGDHETLINRDNDYAKGYDLLTNMNALL